MLLAAVSFDADPTLRWALVLGYTVAILLTVLLAVYVGRRHWETGTGFGLAIVESIVEAHGWSTDTTEATAGGARFEVTGVDAI